ncbi:MAG TPA: nucleotide disphospho-sugar-binding domain-containing protein [Cyclobacteriaceae bacterium]|nr:nucleotide disphospho-sugar-binding domain-containing protein [Cyclobacteriaceae bacterium]
MQPTILILPFHGIGHFNGLFGIARALQKTHNVVFAGTAYFNSHVTSQGFPFRILNSYPFGLGLEGWIHQIRKSESPIFKNIIDRWRDTLYHERVAELTNVLAELRPVHILVDAQQATDVIVLKAIDPSLRVSVLNVAPPYLLMPGHPPANSLALPGDEKSVNEAYKRAMGKIRDKQWRQRIKYFIGLDDRAIVQRRLRRNKMLHLKSDYISLITYAVKNIDQYVLTYREFDFMDDRLKDLRYVGPHADTQAAIPPSDGLLKLVRDVREKGHKLAYCSFGTVPSGKDIRSFVVKLSEAVSRLDCTVIVSAKVVGIPASEKIHVFDWVPQSVVLPGCDLFITHGGMNSVHDGIRFTVPMLVYPIDNTYDQNGNSSRVVYRGLGLRGDFDNDTADEIQRKMIEIFSDIKFRKNLGDLRNKTSHYTTDQFVKMLLS